MFQELMKTMAQTVSAGGNLLGHSIAMTSDFIDLNTTILYCWGIVNQTWVRSQMQLSGGCRSDFGRSYPTHHAGETPTDGRVAGEQRRGCKTGSESDRHFHWHTYFQIYGSTPWRVIRDSGNNDIYYTSSKDKKMIYAIFLDWPESGSMGQ